jgi:hypothetical protein
MNPSSTPRRDFCELSDDSGRLLAPCCKEGSPFCLLRGQELRNRLRTFLCDLHGSVGALKSADKQGLIGTLSQFQLELQYRISRLPPAFVSGVTKKVPTPTYLVISAGCRHLTMTPGGKVAQSGNFDRIATFWLRCERVAQKCF